MSHFTVAVFSKEGQSVDDLLAPFDEGLVVPRYIKYTKKELIEKIEKEIEDYKNSTYEEFLKNPEEYKRNCSNKEHIKYLEEEFPKKLGYTDEELYAEEIEYEDEEDIGKNGEIYSTYNPNSKWDWYQKGGRWEGMLRLKSGGTTNCAKIKLLDFSPDPSKYADAKREWELIIEKSSPLTEEEKDILKWNYYSEEYYLDYYGTKEEYALQSSSFHTYAVVTPDGLWHSKGKMGWFGMSSETSDEAKNWNKSFKELFIDTADPEWILTIVDCHI